MLLRMSSLSPVEFSVRVTSPSEANYTAEARFIQTAAAFFYWAAAEEFARKKRVTLLPEAAEAYWA